MSSEPADRIMTPPVIRGQLLARNTGINLLGQLLPAIVAVICIPTILHGLGVNRFGILSLALVVVGYMSIFDLGLGRATIRYVADALGRSEPERLRPIVWTSLAVQFALGTAGGLILFVATPVLVGHVLRVPADLRGETRNVLYLIAAAIPVLICTASMKGVLEAHQRFGVVNIVKAAAGSAVFALPALGALLHLSLPAVVVLIDMALVGTGLAYFGLALWAVPQLRAGPTFDRAILGRLFHFGSWVVMSTLTIPVLVYSDRILLAALTSVAVLAYYTVPYELVSRLQVIPASFATVLFPAFSTVSATSKEALGTMFSRSVRYLLLVMAPLTVALLISAHSILQVWLGPDFADRGALVLQLIAVGVLLNSLAQVPAHLLDAVGRPDLKAKLFLSYLPLYLPLAWVLVSNWGVTGAALAWLIRAAAELVLFFGVALRLLRFDRSLFNNPWFRRAAVYFSLFVLASFALGAMADGRLGPALVLISSWIVLFSVGLWIAILDEFDRGLLASLASGLVAVISRSRA